MPANIHRRLEWARRKPSRQSGCRPFSCRGSLQVTLRQTFRELPPSGSVLHPSCGAVRTELWS